MGPIENRGERKGVRLACVLPHAPPAVWDLMADIERLARCMPGLSLDGPPEAERVSGHLDVAIGPIRARFKGEGRVLINAAEQRLNVEGRGRDRGGGSDVEGSLDCRMAAAPGGQATKIDLDLSYALRGPLAQIGRGALVADLARRLGQMFADNMHASLTDPDRAPPARAISGLALIARLARDRLVAGLRRLGMGRRA
jgi:carbon-monoxide dehydrogenase small subunit